MPLGSLLPTCCRFAASGPAFSEPHGAAPWISNGVERLAASSNPWPSDSDSSRKIHQKRKAPRGKSAWSLVNWRALRGFEPLAFGFVATDSQEATKCTLVGGYANPPNQAGPESPLTASRDPVEPVSAGQREFLAAGLLQVASAPLPAPTPELFAAAGLAAAGNAAQAGAPRSDAEELLKRAAHQAAALRGEGE